MQELIDRWTKSGFLEGLSKTNQLNLAVLLDNQNKYNTQISNINESVTSSFKKINLPLTFRLYNSLLIKDLINYFPISPELAKIPHRNPSGQLTYSDGNPSTGWLGNFSYISTDLQGDLKQAEEINAKTVKAINREIIGELLLVKEVEHEWINAKHLFDMILMVSSQMERKIGRPATWVVVSLGILNELKQLPEYTQVADNDVDALYLAGKLFKKWDVYVEPSVENEDVLLGFKSPDPTYVGYIFSIFVPFVIQAGSVNDEMPRLGMRRMNKIINMDYYSRIKLTNYSDMLEEFDFVEIMQEYARR